MRRQDRVATARIVLSDEANRRALAYVRSSKSSFLNPNSCMAIDYIRLKHWAFPDVEQTYGTKDTMLYALSLGLVNPMSERQLRFAYEKNLVALPTLAAILGYPGRWMQDPATGIDWAMVVHGENGLRLHRPLPVAGTVVGRTRVTRIIDKGRGKGALVTAERTLTDKQTGRLLATLEQTAVCRGDGGYSAGGQPSDATPAPRPLVPATPPDAQHDHVTRADIALLYRLLADDNPLHADPIVARAAGFPRPILHGLATYALAGHAILHKCCQDDPALLKQLDARFTAPVFPGETVRTEMWRSGHEIQFRARVLERDVLVLDRGYARIE
jgi:acyl dehydratase